MRPRRLELRAFGPFPGSEEVDFDRLAEAGLFLIHGETGSGKTSLIDAMCYALFGSVPGARTSDDLRSDHAGHGDTSVTFEFSLAGADYRIARTPPHRRPKKRGSGLTLQKPKAVLFRRAGDTWQPLADGVEDVGEAMHGLLGLTAAQFQQVVVLPQGEFQNALRADAKERGALLSSLFQTGRFASCAEWLAERARALEVERTSLAAQLAGMRAQAAEHAAHLAAAVAELALAEPTLRRLASELGALADDAGAIRAAAAADASAAREAHRLGSMAAERWDRKRRATEALAGFEAQAPALAALSAHLDAAERAASVEHVLEALEAAERRLNAAIDTRVADRGPVDLAARAAQAHGRVASLGQVPQGWEHRAAPPVEAIRALAAEVRAVLPGLEAAEALAAELGQLRTDAAEAASRAVDLRVQADALDDRASEHDDHELAAGAQLAEAQQLSSQRGSLADSVATLDGQLQAATALPDADDLLADTRVSAADAEQQALESARHLRALLEARVADIAGSLAASLRPGEPCSVCGATAHPSPAAPGAGVADEAIRTADGLASFAREQADSLRVSLDRALMQRNDLASAAGPAAHRVDESRAQLVVLRAELAAASAAAKRVTELTESHEKHRRAAADCRTRAAGLRQQAAASAATADSLAGEVARRASEAMGVNENESAGAAAAVWAATELLTALDRFDVAVVAETESRAAYDEWAMEMSRQAVARGFPSVEAALAALRSLDEVEAMRLRIRAHEAGEAAARATLAEPELVALDTDRTEQIDVDRLGAAAAHLSKVADQAVARHEQVLAAHGAVSHLAAEEQRLAAALDTAAAEATAARRLADVCSGAGNTMKMSLERYVLAARLEEITAIASQRFQAMSDGRYTVRHSDARVKGGGASGLSIMVHDAWTGVERDVRTLSGGETFQASLAYALAVADVVQHHAGGIHIDALFVDEGFGTLHPEALEQAMAELDRLRAGGRLVGIISHVAALHERITTGVEVVKAQTGSHLRTGAA